MKKKYIPIGIVLLFYFKKGEYLAKNSLHEVKYLGRDGYLYLLTFEGACGKPR